MRAGVGSATQPPGLPEARGDEVPPGGALEVPPIREGAERGWASCAPEGHPGTAPPAGSEKDGSGHRANALRSRSKPFRQTNLKLQSSDEAAEPARRFRGGPARRLNYYSV